MLNSEIAEAYLPHYRAQVLARAQSAALWAAALADRVLAARALYKG